MNKAALVEEIAKDLENRKAALAAVDSIVTCITRALKKGDSLALTGFGTFKVVHRKERTARNPRTGDPIKMAARNVVRFVPGKGLKAAVN